MEGPLLDILKTARSQSGDTQKEVESSSDYQKLKQDYEAATKNAARASRRSTKGCATSALRF